MSTPVFRAPAPDSSGGGARSYPDTDAHFFRRDKRGSVKLRMNLSPEEATLIEEAADGTPLMVYIHRVLIDRAKYHIKRRVAEPGLLLSEES